MDAEGLEQLVIEKNRINSRCIFKFLFFDSIYSNELQILNPRQ